MSMRTVVILMAIVGSLLLGYSWHLQDHFIRANEGEVRIACRELCRLRVQAVAGPKGSTLGSLASAFAGTACAQMDDHTEVLLDCRDRLMAAGVTVSTYRCIARAHTLARAQACDESLR